MLRHYVEVAVVSHTVKALSTYRGTGHTVSLVAICISYVCEDLFFECAHSFMRVAYRLSEDLLLYEAGSEIKKELDSCNILRNTTRVFCYCHSARIMRRLIMPLGDAGRLHGFLYLFYVLIIYAS